MRRKKEIKEDRKIQYIFKKRREETTTNDKKKKQ